MNVLIIILFVTPLAKAKVNDIIFTNYSTFCNDNYLTNCSYEFTQNETSRVLNVKMFFLNQWNNNVTVVFNTFELKNGTFKKGIFNYDMPLCDLFHYDQFMIPMFTSSITYSTKTDGLCPIPAGWLMIKDMTMSKRHFPRSFGAGSWKVCGSFRTATAKVLLMMSCLEFKTTVFEANKRAKGK